MTLHSPRLRKGIAYRQKNASRIALNAHTINEGDKDSLAYGEDFRFLPAEQAGEAAQIVLDVSLRMGMMTVWYSLPWLLWMVVA